MTVSVPIGVPSLPGEITAVGYSVVLPTCPTPASTTSRPISTGPFSLPLISSAPSAMKMGPVRLLLSAFRITEPTPVLTKPCVPCSGLSMISTNLPAAYVPSPTTITGGLPPVPASVMGAPCRRYRSVANCRPDTRTGPALPSTVTVPAAPVKIA
ncbi:hypothetical protein D3C87_1270700 [compost metagenome]